MNLLWEHSGVPVIPEVGDESNSQTNPTFTRMRNLVDGVKISSSHSFWDGGHLQRHHRVTQRYWRLEKKLPSGQKTGREHEPYNRTVEVLTFTCKIFQGLEVEELETVQKEHLLEADQEEDGTTHLLLCFPQGGGM